MNLVMACVSLRIARSMARFKSLLAATGDIGLRTFLDLAVFAPQTDSMAHIYLLFDFLSDEEKAQQARHKLEVWKQAFRLDKKLLYKFERAGGADGSAGAEDEAAKKKSKAQAAAGMEEVKLLVRLAFSGHEKLSEQRWIERIPAEEPFAGAKPSVIKPSDAAFEGTESRFEDLA